MTDIHHLIKRQIIRVIDKIIFSEKKKVLKSNGTSLYPAEIHLQLMIENDIDTNATKISEQLGLTKGAIPQTLSHLEKKNIITKSKDPYTINELTMSLTDFGREAYQRCQATRTKFIEAHDALLHKYSSR